MNDARLAREMMIAGCITTIVVLMVWFVSMAIDKEIAYEDTKLEASLSQENRNAIVSSW